MLVNETVQDDLNFKRFNPAFYNFLNLQMFAAKNMKELSNGQRRTSFISIRVLKCTMKCLQSHSQRNMERNAIDERFNEYTKTQECFGSPWENVKSAPIKVLIG